MTRTLPSTKTEPESPMDEQKTVGILVYVLCYEDLLASDSLALPALTFEGATYDIGRGAEEKRIELDGPNVRLWDPFLSRAHARICRREGVDSIEDRGSKLGTFVNGDRIEGLRPLVDNDLVELGHCLFVYRSVNLRTALRLASYPGGVQHGPTRTLNTDLASTSLELGIVARTDQPVLLLAETGAGKEIAARFVHEKSGRNGPFVAVDCGALPEHLVEGELFGHKRGAFSGAHEERKGRIRSAEGGTVFLDELGNLLEGAQASLLRVIQEREVIPIGEDRPQKADVRWIAATNADIFSEQSRFRADLRARLAGYVGMLPPLRKRREDLGFLVADILKRAGLKRASITKRAARAVFFGNMPGNIRELSRMLSSAVALSGEGSIDLAHLTILKTRVAREGADSNAGAALHSPVADTKPESLGEMRGKRPSKETLEAALQKANNVQGEAARVLGVHERQLARWMDAYGMPRGRKSSGA